MKSPTQTLAFTTASLLYSSLPFMLLGVMCTLLAGAALLFSGEGDELLVSKTLLLAALLLALPMAWLSLRILFDARIMQHWAQSANEQAPADFDQGLQDLGLVKQVQIRDLSTHVRGCMRLQKNLIALAVAQWIIFILALAVRIF